MAALCAIGLPACSGKAPAFTIDAAPFAGPESRVDSTGRTHIIIFTAPTGGWSAQHDYTRRQFRQQQVFVTLRRPAPGEPTSQALVEHAIETNVDSTQHAAIYARVLVGRAAPAEESYQLAQSVTVNPASP